MSGSKRLLASIVTLGVLASTIAPVGRAEQLTPENARGCVAGTPEQAKWLADRLYRQAQYERAGDCYQAAGDLADANEAFIKAVEANSDAIAKDLKHQSQIAKTLFTGMQRAFQSNH
jgi:hypothetical protein